MLYSIKKVRRQDGLIETLKRASGTMASAMEKAGLCQPQYKIHSVGIDRMKSIPAARPETEAPVRKRTVSKKQESTNLVLFIQIVLALIERAQEEKATADLAVAKKIAAARLRRRGTIVRALQRLNKSIKSFAQQAGDVIVNLPYLGRMIRKSLVLEARLAELG